MRKSEKQENGKNKATEIKTYSVPFALGQTKEHITINTNTPSKLSKEQIINQAFKFHSQGNMQEAVKHYQYFIAQGFSDHRVFSNYGSILKDFGRLQEAELFIRKAIEESPNFSNYHFNLGNILTAQEKNIEAKKLFQKAIEITPDLVDAHHALGRLLLQEDEYNSCLQHYSKTSELLRGKNNQESNHKRFKIISKAKLEHDIEQFKYLISQNYTTSTFTDLVFIYKKVLTEIDWPNLTDLIHLNSKQQSILKNSYNHLLHRVEIPKLKCEAINNCLNAEEITHDYFEDDFGLTYIDNFLSPTALNYLRNFLLGSTIWFDVKNNGYLGAHLHEGLANPLIIQIADELRKKLPKILKDHPITHIWAYKYDSRAKNKDSSIKGINIHADAAAVNVNFWITPKQANLNPDSGGLIVYNLEAPKDWDFNTFNRNTKRIQEAIKNSKANKKIIPYNENRAVIFDSNLFHETDNYEFKEGYENRRINITILFGRRENS